MVKQMQACKYDQGNQVKQIIKPKEGYWFNEQDNIGLDLFIYVYKSLSGQ